MSLVSFRKPSTSGYAGFNHRVCAPMLDRLRDAKIFAAYISDTDERIMFRDAVRDHHSAMLNKREVMALAAEITDLAEKMKEPNPFLWENIVAIDGTGRTGLDHIRDLLSTSEVTREEARVLMQQGGWKDETIDLYLSRGRDLSNKEQNEIEAELLARDLRSKSNLDIHKLDLEKDSLRSDMGRKLALWVLTLVAVLSVVIVHVWPHVNH